MYDELEQILRKQKSHLSNSLRDVEDSLMKLGECQEKNDRKKFLDLIKVIETSKDKFNEKVSELQKEIDIFIEQYKSSSVSRNIHLPPILGIDLGTSNSTIGYYRLSSRKRGEMEIVCKNDGSRSIPSVVYFDEKGIIVGNEAVLKSVKNPKKFIYDTKRMLGKKFDDQTIQEYRKKWTFDTVKGNDGGILIKIGDKFIEPYKVSGIILKELMNIANTRLNDETNQAIIAIPAYFTDEQVKDTRRAAEFAQIQVIDVIKEPVAAAYCYGYNVEASTKNPRDVLIYDFGGGTLDVSYVEIDGSSFNILSTAGDTELGGQDFTNSIIDLISPKLDEKCHRDWGKNAHFVSIVKKQCEKMKMDLSAKTQSEFYFEIPKEVSKTPNTLFKCKLTRKDFEAKTKPLFDRCMDPVNSVLSRIGRDPHQIDSLILVGGSSYLPMIENKLFEITGKKAYHGVSASDAVSYGACVFGGQHTQKQLKELNQTAHLDNKDDFLSKFETRMTAPMTIGIIKYSKNQPFYDTLIEKGIEFPFEKEILFYNSEIFFEQDTKNVIVPVWGLINDKKVIIGEIPYEVPANTNLRHEDLLMKIKFYQDESDFIYWINKPNESIYNEYSNVILYKNSKTKKDDEKVDSTEQASQKLNESKEIAKSENETNKPTIKKSSSSLSSQGKIDKKVLKNGICIGIYNLIKNDYLLEPIMKQGQAIPCKGSIDLLSTELKLSQDKIYVPIYSIHNEETNKLSELIINMPSNYVTVKRNSPVISIKIRIDEEGLKYSYKRSFDADFTAFQNVVLCEDSLENETKKKSKITEKRILSHRPSSESKCIRLTTLAAIEIDKKDLGRLRNVQIIKQGQMFPQKEEIELNDDDLIKSNDMKKASLPVYINLNNNRISKFNIDFNLQQNYSKKANSPLFKVKFTWDDKSFGYAIKNSNEFDYSPFTQVDINEYIQAYKNKSLQTQTSTLKIPSKIELYFQRKYYKVFDKGDPFSSKKTLIFSNSDLKLNQNSKQLMFVVYNVVREGLKKKLFDISFPIKYTDFIGNNAPNIEILFFWDLNGLQYGIKKSTDPTYKMKIFETKNIK